jgi:hypothetical protein
MSGERDMSDYERAVRVAAIESAMRAVVWSAIGEAIGAVEFAAMAKRVYAEAMNERTQETTRAMYGGKS